MRFARCFALFLICSTLDCVPGKRGGARGRRQPIIDRETRTLGRGRTGGAGAARARTAPAASRRSDARHFDDGWEGLGDLDAFKTEVHEEPARTIITRNDSPDISFDRSINPYRGCEHGCVYCYARPTHCYLGHSAGLDFETKLYAKPNAAAAAGARARQPALRAARRSRSAPTPIPTSRSSASGASRARSSRCWSARRHPVGIVTKSALVVRDIDILARMAKRGLARVALSVTTLDRTRRARDGAARGDAGQAARGDPAC